MEVLITGMWIMKGTSDFMKLEGKYGKALVFTDDLEPGARKQIETLLNQDFMEACKIRIMPDVHEGIGCVIGFTGEMGDKLIPNIVGVDIGCGMLTVRIGKHEIDYNKLDKIIRSNIPSASEVHERKQVDFSQLKDLNIYREIKGMKRVERSIGSLGSGNHFIELGEDSLGDKYLIIHSGSRNLGKQVAEFYQNLAIDLASGKEDYYIKKEELINSYKEMGKKSKINKALKDLEKNYRNLRPKYPANLCYLYGRYRIDYLEDMRIAQAYASLNRITMADIILKNLLGQGVEEFFHFETVHNYIDFEDNIIRKGAIKAGKGDMLLIPLNMRDGCILAEGLGNEEWNNSAPHGAGRLMSRKDAKETWTMEEFKESMLGVYSTSVNPTTLDECPMAYKPKEDIIESIGETVKILDLIRPLYNFKA